MSVTRRRPQRACPAAARGRRCRQKSLKTSERTESSRKTKPGPCFTNSTGPTGWRLRAWRIATALVVPDTSSDAEETYDKNIEDMTRDSPYFEVDRYKARLRVSSPHLARGYDLESHRSNGEKVVIEVKGRAGADQSN